MDNLVSPTPQSAPREAPESSRGAKSPISLNLAFLIITLVSLLLSVFFIYQNWRLTQKLKILVQTRPAPEPAADWDTYIDNIGKFTLQFPEELTPKDQKSEPDASEYTQLFRVFTIFKLDSTPGFMVRVRDGLNAEQLEKEDFDDMEGHVDFKIIKREVISFSGKTATRIKIFVGPPEDYQENRGSTYIYSDIDPQESISIRQLSMDEVQFDKILSTFKFLEQTEQVLGIQTNRCCPCPTKISTTQVGKEGWVLYEKGKNYSSLLPRECEKANCAPCPPIEN